MAGPLIFMFSGQGSQYFHMGRALHATQPVFRETLERLDDLAAASLGRSVMERVHDPSKTAADHFDDFELSHLAIFMTEYALARCLTHAGLQPHALLGASLGEFVAAAVAEVVDVEAAIDTLAGHSRLVSEHLAPGGMLAVLGDLSLYHEDEAVRSRCALAAVNAPSHFVVAGAREPLAEAEAILRKRGAATQRLPVPYAFHAPAMEALREAFMRLHEGLRFREPAIPIVSCAEAGPPRRFDAEHLWRVIRQPIRFMETVQTLERDARGAPRYLDVGPSGTLAAAARHVLETTDGQRVWAVMAPLGDDDARLRQVLRDVVREPREARRAGVVQHTANASGDRVTIREETMRRAVVFPGQGAQHVGMGEGLFEAFPELTATADRVLGYSMRTLCLEDPDERLGQTAFTQPALFTVNALAYLHAASGHNAPPACLAGHSLGEYNALFAAGVFDFETGLQLVAKRGALMAKARGGGMAAVVGLTETQARRVLEDESLTTLHIANLNTPTQIVVAGPEEVVAKAEAAFAAAGASLYRVLKVSGAFHTTYMSEARREFAAFLEGFHFAPPQIPVFANVDARPYMPERIRETLAAQIDSPVRWTELVRRLLGMGVAEFEEVGETGILTRMIEAIRTQADPLPPESLTATETPHSTDPESSAQPEQPARSVQEAPQEATSDRDAAEPAAASATPAPLAPPMSADAQRLGSAFFKESYGLRCAYVAGGMRHGVAGAALVRAMAQAGMLAFYGAGGLPLERVEADIRHLQQELHGAAFGVNLPADDLDDALMALLLRLDVRHVEASGFIQVTPPLVKYRLQGLREGDDGGVLREHTVLAKLSRPEVAEKFLAPPPAAMVEALLTQGEVSPEQARLAHRVPMADHLCAQADAAGPTEQALAAALTPTIRRMAEEALATYGYDRPICVGASGGLGSPEAVAAAFVLGADFVLTGSINQCTVESGASDVVKTMLQQANVQDTDYAPAGGLFELGAKAQVLRRGVFYPARANKLQSLYRHCHSLETLDDATRTQLEERFFRRSLAEVYEEARATLTPEEAAKAESNPKYKMALVFRAYCEAGAEFARKGDLARKVDFQIYCSQAMGAFNQWAKGGPLEAWSDRRVAEVAAALLEGAAVRLSRFCREWEPTSCGRA